MEFSGIFWKFLVIGEYNIQTVAAKFSALFLLHCYDQVAKNVTFISDYSVSYKNAFVNSKRKNNLRTLWNPSYQKQYCTAQKKDVQLEPCIVRSVPNFQHYPGMF